MTEEHANPILLARRPRRPWLQAFLLTTVVFGSGLIVGVVLTSAVLWQHAFNPFRQPPGFDVERLMKDLQYELLLSPDQSKQIREIVSSYNERLKKIRDDVQPRLRNELDLLKKRVEDILRPEQAERWNTRYDEMQRRFLSPDSRSGPPEPDRDRRPPDREGGPRPGDDRPHDVPEAPRPPEDSR